MPKNSLKILAGVALAVLNAVSLPVARVSADPPLPRFQLTDLGQFPRIADDAAPGLSGNGSVVTWAARSEGGFRSRFWKSIPGSSVDLNAPNADSFASDINTHGLAVGFARDPGDLRFTQAFQWHDGDRVVTILPTLGGAHGAARAVEETGLIVGSSDLPDGLHHACLWRKGVARDLGTLPGGDFSTASDLNAGGTVVGASDLAANGKSHAFVWSNGRMQDLGLLPGGSLSVARAINDSGDITGYGDIYGGDIHPILWHQGHPRDLGTLGDEPASAWSINTAGQVVGNSATGPNTMHAFFWQHGVMLDLNDLIPPHTGWILETAYRINDRGWILGTGRLRGASRLFLLRPVRAKSVGLHVH